MSANAAIDRIRISVLRSVTVPRGSTISDALQYRGRIFINLRCPLFGVFTEAMQNRGYINGRNFDLILRSADGVPERLPTIVQEVVALKPDVIVTPTTREAVAVRKETSAIPIVCPTLADAIHLGLIGSEARPGGNVTGIEPYIAGLPAKQIELARELVPDARKIGLLTNQEDPKGPPQATELEAAGKALGLTMVTANASNRDSIENALGTLANERSTLRLCFRPTCSFSTANKLRSLRWRNIFPPCTDIAKTS